MKKYKILFLIIFFLLCTFLIPLSYSKYTNTIRRTFNLNIFAPQKAYFEEFDGSNGELFGFTKSTIYHFSRNTTLSKNEVLGKSGVQLISSTSNDSYRSTDEVYGWVENNNFYWWSEAETVYFHPNTLAPFKEMSNVLTIDLTGTDTSDVWNFSHWFDTDTLLTTITGSIDTSGLKLEYDNSFNYADDVNEGVSTGIGFSFMFNDCKSLTSIDLSRFDTSNATDMKRMFAGCESVTELDVSRFDTSNVKSMFWMFRKIRTAKRLDLRSFDSENLINVYGMFAYSNTVEHIYFSENFTLENVVRMDHMFHSCTVLKEADLYYFNTSNVVNMDSLFMYDRALEMVIFGPNFNIDNTMNIYYMFFSCDKLKVIYAKNDFNPPEGIKTNGIFQGCWVLVGGYGTSYKTTYKDSTNKVDYAKISNSEQNGYFTYYEDYTRYKINYILNGGSVYHDNPERYGSPMLSSIDFYPAVKDGYIFTGWTSSAGQTPTPVVNVTSSMSGDKTYTANYVESDTLVNIPGPCTFDGTNNVVGNDCKNIVDPLNPVDCTTRPYIDTLINLYDTTNFNKNYEISFTISNFDYDSQVNQGTVMNAKLEDSFAGYPGLAVRKNGEKGYLEVTQTLNKNKKTKIFNVSNSGDVVITVYRLNGYIYYRKNENNYVVVQDMRSYNQTFNQTLWFGAAPDGSGGFQRGFVGTLKNITVKLER